ncbi:hypothetical protein BDZ91DRAFT_721750 [Kalaharituber pfeilii]|nr:hypothetical protein BDZ91DRAFT_721750 [Kalaharituber pfeilii]
MSYSNAPLNAKGPVECALQGQSILNSPFFNKGSAFSLSERKAFGIQGLLPTAVHTLEQQVARAYLQLSKRGNDNLAKNTFLTSLKNQNMVLYFKLLETHIEELMGIVYTPTQGDAIAQYSELFRRPEGCFLNISDSREHVIICLREWGNPEDIDYIVVTDSEEILGIGDQGVGGIGISTAKLNLMTLCAGLHPNRTLPVVLDCGTDNEKLLKDELYLGLRHPRIRGQEYDDFVDHFVLTVKRFFPNAVLHFEDFGLGNARRLLEKYRLELPCVNDDIQSTGAVTTAAIYAVCFITGLKMQDVRMVIFGAGTAGMGIAEMVRDAISKEGGRSKEEACEQIWLVDKNGLILESQQDELQNVQKPYTKEDSKWEGVDKRHLKEIIARVKPHVLVGTSTKAGAFTEEVVKEMAKHVDRPAIFPLSNPTRLHEAQPMDLYTWTEGKALIATGSPFPPVEYKGKVYEISECNNALCFPGIGLGCVLSRASICTNEMIVSATKALAKLSPALKDIDKSLLPAIHQIKDISCKVAMAVIRTAVEEGVAGIEGIPVNEGDGVFEEWVARQMWTPEYRPLKKVDAARSSRAARGMLGVGRRGSLVGQED